MIYQTLADSDAGVSVILKLRGETCDIDCLYCYEKRKEAPGGARLDADRVGQLAELFQGRPLAVELHGGEPLTAGKQHVRAVLTELAGIPSVQRVSLQTNGVRLDSEWLDLFDEAYPGLQIGISLDGDADGNAWRVGYDGSPIYPKVVRALELCGERDRKIGLISAVTPNVLDRAEEVLEHLAAFSAVNAISFVPCFDSSVTKTTASIGRTTASRALQATAVGYDGPRWAIWPDEYTRFVLAAAVHWVQSGLHSRLKLEPIVSTIRRLRGLDTMFCHFSDLKCDHVFTLYPEGRIGGCDELPWPAATLGRMGQGLDVLAAQERSRLRSRGLALMSRCTTCSYNATCGGGCLATRLRYTKAGDEDAYCDSRMRLVDGVAALLAQPASPEGVWCRTVRWRPRTPNSMRGVRAFLTRWDDPSAPRPAATLRSSAHGNLNTVGLPGVHEAPDLDPGHPLWDAGIESGVRTLVDACVQRLGAVTYDSCAGHEYREIDLRPVPRRVGVLPRDGEEYAALSAALCGAATIARSLIPSTVEIHVSRAELSCADSGAVFPVLDLSLEPAPGQEWDDYFADVDQATQILTDALRPTPCSCLPGGM